MAAGAQTLDVLLTRHGVLIGAALATTGWLYAAHRARSLARKQHTLNLLIQATFNKEYRETWNAVSKAIAAGVIPDVRPDTSDGSALQLVLNNYELISAGVRSGDFDEQLVKDTLRGAMVHAWVRCEPQILALRSSRARVSIYEHFEWLQNRWTDEKPGGAQRALEWLIGRPLGGRRSAPKM